MFRLNKRSRLTVRNSLMISILLFTCLMIAGCSGGGAEEENGQAETIAPGDRDKAVIEEVIEKEFSGPDEEYMKVRDAAMEAQTEAETQEEFDALAETAVWQDYVVYMEDTYASLFTENGYDKFLNETPAFIYSSFEGDYELSPSDIKIEEIEGRPSVYDFSFQVEYINEDSETGQYQFEGLAGMSEEGKIESIEFDDKDGLYDELRGEN